MTDFIISRMTEHRYKKIWMMHWLPVKPCHQHKLLLAVLVDIENWCCLPNHGDVSVKSINQSTSQSVSQPASQSGRRSVNQSLKKNNKHVKNFVESVCVLLLGFAGIWHVLLINWLIRYQTPYNTCVKQTCKACKISSIKILAQLLLEGYNNK